MISEHKIYEGIFEVLEEEFNEIGRYISFTESNFSTYSIKIQELHLRVCSEIENLLKIIIIHTNFKTEKEIDDLWNSKKSNFLAENKEDYESLKNKLNRKGKDKVDKLLYGFPDFSFYFESACNDFNLNKKCIHFLSILDPESDFKVITPFFVKENNPVPEWWTNYNKLKHNKVDAFTKCTLKDLIYSFGGLFILMNYLTRYSEKNKPKYEEFITPRVSTIALDCEYWAFKSKHFRATNSVQCYNVTAQLNKDVMNENEYENLLEKFNGDLSNHFSEISKKLAFNVKLTKEENFIFHVYYDYQKLANQSPQIIYRKKLRFCKFAN
jgi:hypothetical protein